jgi:hypothetical protein
MLVACLQFVNFPVLPNAYLIVSILLDDRNYNHLSIVSLCLPPSFLRYICSHVILLSIFHRCSPEHPLMRAKGRSILGGERQSFQEYTDVVTSRFVSCFFCGCSVTVFNCFLAWLFSMVCWYHNYVFIIETVLIDGFVIVLSTNWFTLLAFWQVLIVD